MNFFFRISQYQLHFYRDFLFCLVDYGVTLTFKSHKFNTFRIHLFQMIHDVVYLNSLLCLQLKFQINRFIISLTEVYRSGNLCLFILCFQTFYLFSFPIFFLLFSIYFESKFKSSSIFTARQFSTLVPLFYFFFLTLVFIFSLPGFIRLLLQFRQSKLSYSLFFFYDPFTA